VCLTTVLRANSLAPNRLRTLTLASMRVRPSSFTTGMTLKGIWMPSLARYLHRHKRQSQIMQQRILQKVTKGCALLCSCGAGLHCCMPVASTRLARCCTAASHLPTRQPAAAKLVSPCSPHQLKLAIWRDEGDHPVGLICSKVDTLQQKPSSRKSVS
jgi:hypothetical protein